MSEKPVHQTFSAYYRNWKGEISWRTVTPIEVWWGTTEWHKQPQWFLKARDHSREAVRDFALADFLGDTWNDAHTIGDDPQAAKDREFAEISRRASALGYQIVSNEEGNLLGASLTVGNGLSVFGDIEALGRVQSYILAASRHPVEQSDTNRALAKALVNCEALLDAANRKVEELTKLMAAHKC